MVCRSRALCRGTCPLTALEMRVMGLPRRVLPTWVQCAMWVRATPCRARTSCRGGRLHHATLSKHTHRHHRARARTRGCTMVAIGRPPLIISVFARTTTCAHPRTHRNSRGGNIHNDIMQHNTAQQRIRCPGRSVCAPACQIVVAHHPCVRLGEHCARVTRRPDVCGRRGGARWRRRKCGLASSSDHRMLLAASRRTPCHS